MPARVSPAVSNHSIHGLALLSSLLPVSAPLNPTFFSSFSATKKPSLCAPDAFNFKAHSQYPADRSCTPDLHSPMLISISGLSPTRSTARPSTERRCREPSLPPNRTVHPLKRTIQKSGCSVRLHPSSTSLLPSVSFFI